MTSGFRRICGTLIVISLLACGASAQQQATVADGAIGDSGSMLYWTDTVQGSVHRMVSTGGAVETLASGRNGPFGIAVDAGRGMVYWAETPTRTIMRCRLDGAGIETVVQASTSFPRGLDIDPRSNELYWTDPIFKTIQRYDIATGQLDTIVTLAIAAQDVKVDTRSDRLLWIIPTEGIYSMPLAGGPITPISEVFYGQALTFAVNTERSRVYWGAGLRLRTQEIEGGCLDIFDPLVGSLAGIVFDTATGRMIWTEENTSAIYTLTPGENASAAPLMTGQGVPGRLALGPAVVATTLLLAPESLIANPGTPFLLEFHLNATDGVRMFWRKDGAVIQNNNRVSGADTPQLVVSGASLKDIGLYDCVVIAPDRVFVTPPAIVAVRPDLE